MLPLFDMLANAQNGKGIDLLARQFNLTQQQTELALEALLPAFSQGLKRNTSDPYGIAGFMTALASGQHARYFDNASARLLAGRHGRRQRHPRPSVRLEGSVARGGVAGGAGDRHRPERAAADAAGDRRDADGRAVQAVDQPAAGRRRFGAQQSARRDHRADDAARRRRWRSAAAQQPAAAKRARPVRQSVRQGAEGHVRRWRGGTDCSRSAQPAPEAGSDNPFGKILQDMLGGGAAAPAAAAARGRRPMSPPTIRSARFSRRCWAAAAVRRTRRPRPIRNHRRARAPIRADAPRTPMTIFSATCSRPAARPATTTRRAWSWCSTSSSGAWTTRASCAWSAVSSWCAPRAAA